MRRPIGKFSERTGTKEDLAFLDLAIALGYRVTVGEAGDVTIDSPVQAHPWSAAREPVSAVKD